MNLLPIARFDMEKKGLNEAGQIPDSQDRADWYLYLVRCCNGSLYTGITTDISRRLAEHRGNHGAGAKYLRGRGPLVLVFQKRLGSRSLALSVESRVKKLPKPRKEELIKAGKHIDGIIKRSTRD